MKRGVFFISVFLLLTAFAVMDEVWMRPVKFVHKVGEAIQINFRSGDNFYGLTWKFEPQQIKKVDIHQKNTVNVLTSQIAADPKVNVSTPLAVEGTYVVSMETGEEVSETEAEKFNAYLSDYALDDANYYRKKNNLTEKRGTELVTRYTKLIVQAGDKLDNTFRKELGHPVEIVPEQHPYSLKVGDPVRFKILYNKKPLFGVRVKVWNQYNNKVSVQNIFAQQDGVIETHITNNGSWMVSFAKMIPSKDPRADWQTLRASLVFGIK